MRRALVRLEAGDVRFVRIEETRVAVRHPLRDQARRAGAFPHPHGRRRPEIGHLGGLAQQLLGIGREREQAVHGVLHLGAGQELAHDLARVLQLRREVAGREGQFGGRALRLGDGGNVVRAHQDGTMRVGAHLHRSVALALVHERVHVAHDGVADLVAGAEQEFDRAEVGHLVHRGCERGGGAGHGGDARAPDAAGDNRVVDLDGPAGRRNGADTRTPEGHGVHFETGHLGLIQDREHAPGQGPLAHDRARPDRVDDGHARRVEAAEDDVRVDERDPGDDFRRLQQLALDAPHTRRGHAPAQLLHALFGARDLDPPAGRVDAQRLVLALALERDQRNFASVIGREDEVGRVARGPAGVGKRAHLDQHQVVPAEPRQVLDQAVADDAGADDGDFGSGRSGRLVAHGRASAPDDLLHSSQGPSPV